MMLYYVWHHISQELSVQVCDAIYEIQITNCLLRFSSQYLLPVFLIHHFFFFFFPTCPFFFCMSVVSFFHVLFQVLSTFSLLFCCYTYHFTSFLFWVSKIKLNVNMKKKINYFKIFSCHNFQVEY